MDEKKELRNIENQTYHIINAPFNSDGKPAVWVQVRKLTQIQTEACGGFSLISLVKDKMGQGKQLSTKELIRYAEIHHKLIEAALVKPTYKQIFETLTIDPGIQQQKESLKELKKKLEGTPKNDKRRRELENEIDMKIILTEFILPADFIGWIVGFSLGIDESDIRLVSEKMLLEAAILAEKYHKRPSEIITGAFTDFMKKDFDCRALEILEDERKKK